MKKPAETPRRSLFGLLPYVYLFVLLPCLIYTIFYTARAIRLDYIPVPVWDNWRFAQAMNETPSFNLRHFLVPHNDHRIIFPEIVYALDYLLFRGRQWFPLAFNIACLFVQVGVLWYVLARTELPRAFRMALGAACALFIVSTMQVIGMTGAISVQWYLSATAAAVSFLFLWRSALSGRLFSLIISVSMAVVVTYSTGNGMAIWPVLATMATLLRLPRRRVAGVAIAGILSITAYFVNYTFTSHSAAFLAHPFYAVWFAGVFLGSPVSDVNVRLGGVIGLASLLFVAAAVAFAVRRRRIADAGSAVTAGFCLYVASSAFLIAYGRMEPGDATVLAAKAGRYVSMPLAYWGSLTVMAGWLAVRLPARRTAGLHLAAAGFTAMLLIAVMGRQEVWERALAEQQAVRHESGIALATGIEDPEVIRVLYPDPQFALDQVGGMRKKRVSVFSSGRQNWIGQAVERVSWIGSPSFCFGSLDKLSAIADGYRATGSAVDKETGRRVEDIVLADPAGTIVGFGETRAGGYPPVGPASTWVGFARTGLKAVQAYALVHGGTVACPLGAPLPVPHIRPAVSLSSLGLDLAKGKPATQSSMLVPGWPNAQPQNATDGNTNGDLSAGSVTSTNLDANPWWQVDLGNSTAIGSISIWNRTDCCAERLNDYWVFVSDTPFGPTDTVATLQSRAATWSSHQTSHPNPSTSIPVNAQGRYVRVQIGGTNYLSLAEVQVFGK